MTKQGKSSRNRNLGIAGLLALTGFIPVVFGVFALLVGLWLDAQIGQRGPLTTVLILISVPVSLFLMVRIALYLVRKMDFPAVSGSEDAE